MSIVKRGHKFYFDSVIAGVRHRCSLGTSDAKAASRLENRIAFALADGPRSPVWSELKKALPVSSFEALSSGVVLRDPLKLAQLDQKFYDHIKHRRQLVEISSSTLKNYNRNARLFFDWAIRGGLKTIEDLTPKTVEDYLLWRKEMIAAKGGSGRGIVSDVVVLSALFNFAVEEGWITKSPLRHKPKLPVVTEPVQPFTEEEMGLLEMVEKSPTEKALFAILKHTGLRCGDVVDLRWSAFDFKTHTLRWRTQKRGKLVEIPMTFPLREALSGFEIDGEPLLFPGIRTNKLYNMVRAWGEKAGVENVFPHRFRHSFVCRMLARGLTLFDVAQLIGDTTAVCEKHYAKWTSGQEDRIRGTMSEGD